MEKFRIVSDGTPNSTKVFDSSGNQVKSVKRVKISMEPGCIFAEITLLAVNPVVDVTADSKVSSD